MKGMLTYDNARNKSFRGSHVLINISMVNTHELIDLNQADDK